LVVALFLLAGGIWAQSRQTIRAALSPVPPYPRDGVIPEGLRGESVFLDTVTGDLVVLLPVPGAPADAAGGRAELRVTLARHVRPQLSVSISKAPGGFTYAYAVVNEAAARQTIRSFYLAVPQPQPRAPGPPTAEVGLPVGWERIDYAPKPGMWTSRWDALESAPGIPGAARISGFQLSNGNLPGITRAYFQGPMSRTELPTDLPEAALVKLAVVQGLEFNSVALPTIGPKFPAGTDKSTIASDFRLEIGILAHQGVLAAESPFVRETLSSLGSFLESQPAEEGGVSTGVIPSLKQKPGSQLEREIREALRLSLGME
jgi:hypothetical protein